MDIHIRRNTLYHWHAFGADSTSGRGYIIDSVERVLNSEGSCRRDLFLPNCFIDGLENARFWFKMAAIICGDEGVADWHVMEYGAPLSKEDLHQRYVYTWSLRGDEYKFYTKTLNDGYCRELVWYVCKLSRHQEDSADDTDEEEVLLRVYP